MNRITIAVLLLLAVIFLPVTANAQMGRNTVLRLYGSTGAPATGCTSINDTRKVYLRTDAGAVASSLYICANTAPGTYGWELVQSAAAPGAGPSALDLLTGNGNNIYTLYPWTNGSAGQAMFPDGVIGNIVVPGVLSVQNSTTDQIAAATVSTTETAFATTYTIPANYFVANRVLKVTMVFVTTTSASPASQRIRVRLGGLAGTVVHDTTAVAGIGTAMTSRTSVAQIYLQGTAAPGASVNVQAGWQACGNAPVTLCSTSNVIAQPVAVATNTQQALTVTLTYGANTAGNTVNLNQMIVESLN